MRKKLVPTALTIITLLALTLSYNPTYAQLSAPTAPSQPTNCQAFPETGKTVCGTFLTYWQSHGGLAQQGYPISGQFSEKSDVDGKTYTVQYFERAVFELHPENKPPFDVLLSLLGTARLHQKYPNGAPAPPTANMPPNAVLFPETGQYLDEPFLTYWKSHGGLAQQGYPISGQFSEKSDLNGQLYKVQYFERAVMEYHPELDQLNNVLLTQLGTLRFKEKYPNGDPSATPGTPVAQGVWGSDGISMNVTAAGATIEFPCANATVNQPLTVDSGGNFNVTGIFVQEHGGPVFVGDDQGRPARFTGVVIGQKISITIIYTDDNTKIGTWSASFGNQGRVIKCM